MKRGGGERGGGNAIKSENKNKQLVHCNCRVFCMIIWPSRRAFTRKKIIYPLMTSLRSLQGEKNMCRSIHVLQFLNTSICWNFVKHVIFIKQILTSLDVQGRGLSFHHLIQSTTNLQILETPPLHTTTSRVNFITNSYQGTLSEC